MGKKSSSLVSLPFEPIPPLPWVLNSDNGVLLIYPRCEMVITIFLVSIKIFRIKFFSIRNKFGPSFIIRYFSLISISSSLIIFILKASSDKNQFKVFNLFQQFIIFLLDFISFKSGKLL